MRVSKIAIFFFLYFLSGLILCFFFLNSGLDREVFILNTFGISEIYFILFANGANTVLLFLVYVFAAERKKRLQLRVLGISLLLLLLLALTIIMRGDNKANDLLSALIFISPHLSWIYPMVVVNVLFRVLIIWSVGTILNPEFLNLFVFIVFFVILFIIYLWYKIIYFFFREFTN